MSRIKTVCHPEYFANEILFNRLTIEIGHPEPEATLVPDREALSFKCR
jgi:hypothetical protein